MLDFIKSRRSTRKYKKDKVSNELLEKIIEAGRYAPSGGNNQSTHFIVITNDEVLSTLNKLVKQEFEKWEITEDMYKSKKSSVLRSKQGDYHFTYDAPALILCANKINYGNNMADVCCAMENMMLMANALDLGSCYVNQLNWLNTNGVITTYLKSMGLNDDERVYASLIVGYPDTKDGLPNREPLERVGNKVTYIK